MDPLSDTVAASDTGELSEIRHQPGEVIGRYQLIKLLGVGGMGEVWEAQHNEIGKRAAVKFLFPQLAADPTFVERFRREAMATANLDHPNICRALDFSSSDTETFLILDFVQGVALADKMMAGEKFSPEDVVTVARAICEGLNAAHNIGIVHRDLKPENIIVAEDDLADLKILDFGISAFAGANNERLTQTGQAIGTPAYMSPEQITSREITSSSDLYALGVVMYEMLGGRPPFESEVPFEVLEGHMRTAPPPLHLFRPDVPPSLEALIHRLLSKSPDDRPSGATELATILATLDLTPAQPPSGPRPPSATTSMETRSPSNIPKRAIIIAIAFALFAVPMLGFGIWVLTSDTPSSQLKETRARSFAEERSDALAKPDVQPVASLFAKGSFELAASKAAEQLETDADNPHLLSLKAEAEIGAGDLNGGLDTFSMVTKKDPRYLGYEPLISTFTRCIKAKGCESLAPREWDLSHAEAGDFVEALFQFAIANNNSSNQRGLAEKALKAFGGTAALETWQADALILVNDSSCDKRTTAIKSLADSSVPDAKKLLETFDAKPKGGCGLLGLKDCIACLRGPLDTALRK